jgi:hypothetical protein
MSRHDVVPIGLRSPIGPTRAQWHAMATAVLGDGDVRRASDSLTTFRRIRNRGWLDEAGRVNKRGLAAMLTMSEPRDDRHSRFDRA